MSWLRIDDDFSDNPKIIAAGNEAVGLYVRCGAYCAKHLTDGNIPESIALLYGSGALADTLVRTKLWRRVRGGYKMRDYLDYNPSKETVDKERKQAAERQRRRREDMMSRRDNTVTHTTPTRPDPKNGSAGTVTERGHPTTVRKPVTSSSSNGAATRQPPPFAEAQRRAVHPEGTP